MPLHAERKARRIGNPDRLDGAVFRHALDDDPLARFEDALAVQRIHADGLAAEEPGERAVRGTSWTSWRSAKTTVRIGMDLAVLQPRHAMVHASRQLADLRMQRAAEGDVHLLQAAADAEERHAARDAGFRSAPAPSSSRWMIVRFVPRMRLGAEAGRMNIGAGAGQHDAVDRVQQRADVGDVGRCRQTSAAARRELRPRREGCALRPSVSRNRSSMRWAFPITPTTGRPHQSASSRKIFSLGTISRGRSCPASPRRINSSSRSRGDVRPALLFPREGLSWVRSPRPPRQIPRALKRRRSAADHPAVQPRQFSLRSRVSRARPARRRNRAASNRSAPPRR